jgi:hypothetical protein
MAIGEFRNTLEVVTKLSSRDGTIRGGSRSRFSGVEIEDSVDALIRRDEALRLV